MQTLEIRGWEINVNDRRLNRIKKYPIELENN